MVPGGTAGVCEAVEPSDSNPPSITVREGLSTFGDAIDVHLVNVEVFVTDRKGNPVEGLTVDDFVLEEDGRPVPISHFSEVEGGTAVGSFDPGLEGQVPTFTESSVLAPTHLVIFIDGVNIRAAGRRRVIENLRAFLAARPVDPDRVLIVAQKPYIESLAAFGSTYEELDSALVEIENTPTFGHQLDRDRRFLVSHLRELFLAAQSTGVLDPCEELANAGQRALEAYSQQVRSRVGTAMRHLATLASALGGVPGNKIVLYVSDGLELEPGLDLQAQLVEQCPDRSRDFVLLGGGPDMIRRFHQLTRHANANRVSFYTIDAMGHRLGSTATVDAEDLAWTASTTSDRIRADNLQSSLALLAGETGGRTIFGQNDISDALEKIENDLESYYSLAYAPPQRGDDRVHILDVRLPGRKKLRVRHRLSYRDKGSMERMADRVQTALTLGVQQNPLDAELAHGVIRSKAERNLYEVPLRITVPLDKLVFLPRDDKLVGALQLQVMARDAEGRYAAFHNKVLEVELDASLEGRPQGRHTFVVALEMRGGEHVVAAGIRDATGRSTSYLASKVVVAETNEPRPVAEARSDTER